MDNPMTVDLGRIAQDLQIRRVQVESVVQLLDEGNTVPFITRYRKERTGGLNEVVIREIQLRVGRLRELAERKETILKAIEGQGKLTEDLAAAIRASDSPKKLEDLYLPFKPKKRTKASDAREKGLEPLALRIWNRDESLTDLAGAAQEFVNAERGVETIEQVLEGVGHILAESINELAPVRDAVRRIVWRTGKLVTSKAEQVPEGQGLDYRDYFAYTEPVNHVPAHRVLAINRGEKEGVLKGKLDVPVPELERALFAQLPLEEHPQREAFTSAALDALNRLLLPSLEREVRRDLTEMAEKHAVEVFARNLRSLLLQPPIQRQRVLAIDPGFRTGCKVAILDEYGTLVEHDVVHPHQPQNKRAEAKVRLKDLVAKHEVNVVAIGNGTACRETEELVAELIAEGTYFHTHPGETIYPFAKQAKGPRPQPQPGTAPEGDDAGAPAEGEVVIEGTPQVEPEHDTQHNTPMGQTDNAESQGPSDEEIAAPTDEAAPSTDPAAEATGEFHPVVTEGTPQGEPEPEPQHSTPMGQTENAEAPSDVEETPPPITGGAPDEGEEPAEGEPPAQPPPSSAPEANDPEGEAEKADQLASDESQRNPAHEPERATEAEGAGEAETQAQGAVDAESAAVAPPIPELAVAPEGEATNPAPEAEGESAEGEAIATAEGEALKPPPTGEPEEEKVQPIALDFTHLPVGPKPKSESKPPKPPKPPRTPPPPPAPHGADPLLSQLSYVIVNEAGASVYSTSPAGRDEFPELDATTRGTVSIGRRLQDPLAELVKIEPQNIGVGLYQHDVNPKQLKDSLEQVIESCVNFVGVDLNSASVALLRHVAGLNALTAKRLVDFRKEKGAFASREQIREVEGIGPITYTQAAGFLKIRENAHPFDRTWIHPESYEAATKLLASLGYEPADILDRAKLEELNGKLNEVDVAAASRDLAVGEPTLRDICEALARPDRDPREDLPKPIFKKGVLKLEDLNAGMELKGTVLNVVDFGAFVDIGLKDSGLVHISQLANRYVKSPHDVVSVGDVVTVWVLGVDGERKRVSLTMVPPGTERPKPGERRDRRGGPPPGPEGAPGGGPGGPGGERRERRGGPPPGRRGDRGGPGGPRPQGGESTPPPPAQRLRIPGPPQRLQRGGPGRGGRPGGPGRGGPGRGGPGGPGGGGPRPEPHGTEAPRPKPRPAGPSPLTEEAISGNVPLRSFGQLKQLFEARSKTPEEEAAGAQAAGTPLGDDAPPSDEPQTPEASSGE